MIGGGIILKSSLLTTRDQLFMSLLLAESHPIPLHAIAAMIAIILGGIQHEKRRDHPQAVGRIWVGLMLIVSVSSFFIHEIKLWGLTARYIY